jgi:cob(I)alamin adenosyltransferase
MTKEVQIYTKTGDDGTTGLIGGTRVKKYDARLEAYGTVDELNSHIGLILTTDVDERSREMLTEIQSKLFIIGSQLATDDQDGVFRERIPCSEQDIEKLEQEMDHMFEVLPRLSHFILPAGSTGAAYTHVARTVCRRAERRIVELADKKEVNTNLIRYINRLSDYLFVLARKINQDHHHDEISWIPEKREK